MGFSNHDQLRELFYAGGMGFLLGGYYDIFRILRKLLHIGKWVTCLCDCLFFLTAAVGVFLFSLAMTEGVVRGYVLCGIVCGFIAYRYTVGKTMLHIVGVFMRMGHRVVMWFQRVTAVPRRVLGGWIGKLWEKTRKLLKKVCFFSKKGLQQREEV